LEQLVSAAITKSSPFPLYRIEANPQLVPPINENLLLNGISNFKVYTFRIGDADVPYLYFGEGKTNIHRLVQSTPKQGCIPV
jgi:hypothetical protein